MSTTSPAKRAANVKTPKNERELFKTLSAQGWRIERNRDGNACYAPDGKTLIQFHQFHGTPDPHAWKNQLMRFKRAGAQVGC